MAGNRLWTDEDKKELLRLHKLGESTKDISIALNRSRNAVLGMLFRLRNELDEQTVPHTLLRSPKKEKEVILRFKKHKLPTKSHPLVRRLFVLMNEQQCSIDQMSKNVGIARATLQQWKWHNQPSLELLIACFNYLGYDLKPVKMKDEDA